VLTDGRVQELFYCAACGSPFWRDRAIVEAKPR